MFKKTLLCVLWVSAVSETIRLAKGGVEGEAFHTASVSMLQYQLFNTTDFERCL
jgi:hypothetical protein